ncbi:dihydroneopterin aldolase [Nitrospirillum viridazoti]|uniref:7,8-dihydroneopterin aldolase n=1 Tax=Nitrospirillum viridazoti CBAmc TaxID=1441467 RepID=A0A248JS65_9PROT|nr:dihydroneopterin aldolase [Nitrospirillum amazonense]ASG21321.1 dihydroneopterin aldolase [Nitrospirillum amazonense CBAmc]TWB32989.1 dihydroneopterin aldolase [Nitrospirillum amazonense]
MNKLFAQVTGTAAKAAPAQVRSPAVANPPVASSSLARIFVRDLVVMAVIGIYEHEKQKAQRLRVNLDMMVLDRLGLRRDDIADVVSYEDGVTIVRELAAQGHLHLVETFAETVAQRLLADGRVHSVTVRVEKLDVFPDAASAGIEITRQRG